MNPDRIRELAKSGQSESLVDVKKAFEHKDPRFKTAALLGLWDACRANPSSEGTAALCDKELFECVAAVIEHKFVLGRHSAREPGSKGDREKAIEILPRMNVAKAAEFLQQPSVLRTSNPDFPDILKVLSDHGVALHHSIEEYVTEFRSKALADEHPYPYFYGQVLRAAATQKHPKIKELIQDALDNFRDWTVTENAAEAQWIMLDLSPTLEKDILILAQKIGFENMELPLQHYYVVFDYFHDTMNGGLSQYFYNPGSDQARLVLEALTVMEINISAYELAAAMMLFGPSGPPTDRTQRWNMMDANDRRIFGLIDDIKSPSSVSQKFETIVHAKLYLAKHVETCQKVPRSYP